MFGRKNYKGEDIISGKDFERVEEKELLLQELQNFYHIFIGECFWDKNHGLDKNILFSQNKSAIQSEIINKTLKYYGDRVLSFENINIIIIEDKKTTFTADINTTFGKITVGGENENSYRNS